jgi:hypothetical protein
VGLPRSLRSLAMTNILKENQEPARR